MIVGNECDKQTILQETRFKDSKHLNFVQLFIILSILVHFVAAKTSILLQLNQSILLQLNQSILETFTINFKTCAEITGIFLKGFTDHSPFKDEAFYHLSLPY